MTVAEQYLIAVFKDVPNELDQLSKEGVNKFCHLQLIARKKLTDFFDSPQNSSHGNHHQHVSDGKDRYINLMSNEQQLVFCGVYWHGKTISKLAIELSKTEDAVKKILKDCFTIIRNCSK